MLLTSDERIEALVRSVEPLSGDRAEFLTLELIAYWLNAFRILLSRFYQLFWNI